MNVCSRAEAGQENTHTHLYLLCMHVFHGYFDRGPMGMYFQWVRRFGTQNGAQNRVQNRPQNRVQNGKIDIQSWVLIRPFSASFGPRNGREMAIRPTKKADF